jgi:hypothetical protein
VSAGSFPKTTQQYCEALSSEIVKSQTHQGSSKKTVRLYNVPSPSKQLKMKNGRPKGKATDIGDN